MTLLNDQEKTGWIVSDEVKKSLRLGSDSNYINKLLAATLRYFHRVRRPTLIGPIAVDIGVNLRQMKELIDLLVSNDQVRAMSIDDYKNRELGGELYVLSCNCVKNP